MISSKRLHRVIYTLITHKYATLKELKTSYTIEEALDMYEACLFNLHNKAAAIQSLNTHK